MAETAYYAQPVASILLDEMEEEAYCIAVLHQSAPRYQADGKLKQAIITKVEAHERQDDLTATVRATTLYNGATYLRRQPMNWNEDSESGYLLAASGSLKRAPVTPAERPMTLREGARVAGLTVLAFVAGLLAIGAIWWAFAPLWTQGVNF